MHLQQLKSHRSLRREWEKEELLWSHYPVFGLTQSFTGKRRQLYTPAEGKVLFQDTRYCGLTGQGMMKEKANTMVRHRNKERKNTAVRQWVSLAKPKTSLQLFFFSSVADGAVAVSTPSSPLFSGSPSEELPVDSIVVSKHYQAHSSERQGREDQSKTSARTTPLGSHLYLT